MYNVIIVLDNAKNRSYYYTYVESDGNIVCDELPPYQDINKARSCYWNEGDWVYDPDKCAEIVAEQENAKAAAEQARIEAEAVPTLEEIAAATMEIAENVSANMDAIAELATMVSKILSERGDEV